MVCYAVHETLTIERNFAHQFDTGGMDRLYVRGRGNVQKKLLIQAAACNLALIMRSWYGAGKPKAAHERLAAAILTILAVIRACDDDCEAECTSPCRRCLGTQRQLVRTCILRSRQKTTV